MNLETRKKKLKNNNNKIRSIKWKSDQYGICKAPAFKASI
jgi:hypothetical protein